MDIFHNTQELGRWESFSEPLYDTQGDPLWLEHPTHARRVDAIALPLTNVSGAQLYPYDPNNPGDLIRFGPSESVSIIGFPFGLTTAGRWGSGYRARLRRRPYIAAVGLTFRNNIDWAQLQKTYATDPAAARGRYSPPVCTGVKTRILKGDPDPAKISTSYVERQNLTMRMGIRRFTRLTNGFSKKLDNHMAAIALHFMHYNFARPHTTLADPYPRTPAMAAGVSDHVWTMTEIAALLD
jgi:hypothetical protein